MAKPRLQATVNCDMGEVCLELCVSRTVGVRVHTVDLAASLNSGRVGPTSSDISARDIVLEQ